jgi:chromosome segregation ATPase
MSQKRNWLTIAEYISVAGSVVGSAIVLVSQQAIYGLAPVTVSLLLNLINRRRLEQLCQQRPNATTQIEQLKSAINSLSVASAQVQQDVDNLVPRQELTAIATKVEELNLQQQGLRLSLVPLQSRLDDLIADFNRRPELEQIEGLTTVIVALKQLIDELPRPDRLQLESAELQQQAQTTLAQVSQNSERVKQLEQAIAQIQQQLINLR